MDIKNNYYFKNFESFNIVYTDYWDFNLTPDKIGDPVNYATSCKGSCNYNIITDGLVTWFDINNNATTVDGTSLTSLIEWSGRTIIPSSGFTLNDWGLTGVDNGRTTCLSGETLVITSADTKLVLYPVTGYTILYTGCTSGSTGCTECVVGPGLYVYPWSIKYNQTTPQGCPVGDVICLDGGFYQGFFKLDNNLPAPIIEEYTDECGNPKNKLVSVSGYTQWQVMPTEFPIGWTMETWVNWSNLNCLTGQTGTTLNQIYPNNKNFFFYIGTRAENKFWNDFSGETGLKTTKGIPLSRTDSLDYENQVVDPNSGQSWFARSSSISCDCCCHSTESNIDPNSGIITGGQNWFSRKSKRGCDCLSCDVPTSATTVVTGTTYTYCDQLSENALGFRITDDGRIGYRKMTVSGDCYNNKFRITGTMMEEGYSEAGIIPTGNTWNHIVVTYVAGGSKNTLPAGTLTFWVNGLAKYKVKDFIGLQLRALDEWSDKQIGVPFNLSWGGGTQGLIESQTFNGPDYEDKGLWLQENFAGSFEGQLSQLRFYEKPLNVLEIRNNFFVDCRRYCRPDTFGGAQIVQPNSPICGSCKSPLPPYVLENCNDIIISDTELIITNSEGSGIIWE